MLTLTDLVKLTGRHTEQMVCRFWIFNCFCISMKILSKPSGVWPVGHCTSIAWGLLEMTGWPPATAKTITSPLVPPFENSGEWSLWITAAVLRCENKRTMSNGALWVKSSPPLPVLSLRDQVFHRGSQAESNTGVMKPCHCFWDMLISTSRVRRKPLFSGLL